MEFIYSVFSYSRTGMTVSRATARACPSWARTRDPTPVRPRCLTHRPRTSSRPTFRRRTSRSLTTRARTRTPTSPTRTPSTRCTRASRARGAHGSGRTRRWSGWIAPRCWHNLGPRCLSCPGWTRGGTTV